MMQEQEKKKQLAKKRKSPLLESEDQKAIVRRAKRFSTRGTYVYPPSHMRFDFLYVYHVA
jgi:hypothetical protein